MKSFWFDYFFVSSAAALTQHQASDDPQSVWYYDTHGSTILKYLKFCLVMNIRILLVF